MEHGIKIIRFRTKNLVHGATVEIHGKLLFKIITAQNGKYFINTGSAIEGNRQRHQLDEELARKFEAFIATEGEHCIYLTVNGNCALHSDGIDLQEPCIGEACEDKLLEE